ncbi:MAG: ABC transporter substrate-binding protein [Rubrivivax sp.]|nr:ABC transporter substrate-binding protein [Rubrivivax sp.]
MPLPTRRQLVQVSAALWLPATLRAADELVIGQSITLQGGKNAYGSDVLAGVRVLLDAVNREGGVNGRRLALRTLDDDNRADEAEANARRLVAEGALLLFGSIEGGPSGAVMKAAVETGTPFFGPMAGSPGLRRPFQPLVFPVRAEHRDEFRALIQYGVGTGLKRVALFHADSDTGRQHLDNVRLLAEQARMGFGGGAAFQGDVSDAQLDAVAAALAGRQVDLVLNHGSPGVYERLIRRARAAGHRTSFWGVNSGSSPMAAALGPLARGMVFAQIVPSPFARKTALTREYQARWRATSVDTPFSYGSLEGYMTAKALVSALRAAGPAPTRTSLLKGLQDFETDLGGVQLRYRGTEHDGSRFVDLAMVGSDGRFIQ